MAYTDNEKSTGLDVLTSLAQNDLHIVGDVSDSGRAKAITEDNLEDTIANSTNFINELTANATFITNLNTISPSPLTTKGDIFTHNTTDPDRLPVGTDGQILSADSGETTGLKWIDATFGGGGGGGTKIAIDTTNTTVNSGTSTVFTVSVPAGTLGSNDAIRFKMLLSSLSINNGGNAQVNVKYGGTTIGSVAFISNDASGLTGDAVVFGEIIANNATNAQKGIVSGLMVTDSSVDNIPDNTDYGTSAVDSTAAQNLVFEIAISGTATATAQAVIVEGINKGNIRTSTTSLAAADILSLNSTPVEIIPNPGVGKAINIIDVNAKLTFVSGAYAANTELDIIYAGQSAEVLKNITLLPSGSTLFDTFITGSQSKLIDNVAVQVKALSGNPTTGNGTLKIYAVYEIITL